MWSQSFLSGIATILKRGCYYFQARFLSISSGSISKNSRSTVAKCSEFFVSFIACALYLLVFSIFARALIFTRPFDLRLHSIYLCFDLNHSLRLSLLSRRLPGSTLKVVLAPLPRSFRYKHLLGTA